MLSPPPTAAYSGTAPGDSVTGYCALVMEHTGANAIQYFVSEYISTEANLYVLLVITILAVPLFTVADIHYGSGTSRNICGKKRPASEDNGCTQCEPVSSSQENGKCVRWLAPHNTHACLVCMERDSSSSISCTLCCVMSNVLHTLTN